MKITWTEGTRSKECSFDHTAVWLNGRVYVGGGRETIFLSSNSINCYDPDRDSWNSINIDYRDFAMTILDNKLVIVGGHAKEGGKKTEKIQTLNAANQLEGYNNLKMREARSHATAAGHQEILIVTGGKGEGNPEVILSSTELLHSKNGQLFECPDLCRDLPSCRFSPKSVIVDNTLYVLGGYHGGGDSKKVYTASLDSDTVLTQGLRWNTSSDETPFYASAPVSVNGTHLLIVGGYNRVEQKHIYTSNIHKPIDKKRINDNTEIIGRIPSARSYSAAVCTADNRLIVIGGYDDKSKSTNTVWIGSFARKPQS